MELIIGGVTFSEPEGCNTTTVRNFVDSKADKIPQRCIHLKDFFDSHAGYIDDKNRLHFQFACDGTYIFLDEMVQVLQGLGCTDITVEDETIPKDETPEGKPWCNCLFSASGILPVGTKWRT